VALLIAVPAFAQTGTSPWENAVSVLQTAFTSTIARGLSLVAIVVAGLTFPKQQFLIKTPELAKVANLNVDAKSYWLYTNDPYDNKKRKEAFEVHGFEKGLEILAGRHS
jgi:hypothetical protein